MTLSVPPLLHEEAPATPRKRLVLIVIALAVAAVLMATVSWWWSRGRDANAIAVSGSLPTVQTDPMAVAPAGVRIRVRVVNTTDVNGLAKRATTLLRDHGFDVVEYGSDKRKPRATTLVQTHTANDEWSERVLRLLRAGTAEPSTDSSHFVDLTILLGQDWKAPPQSFRP